MENTLKRINGAVLKFLVPLTLEETYSMIVNEAIKLVKGSGGSILLKIDNELIRVYSSDPAIMKVKARKYGYANKALSTGKPLVIHYREASEAHPEIFYRDVKSVIFIPLSYRNTAIGVLHVRSSKNQFFTPKKLDILKLYGSYASLAVIKNRLYDETKKALETRDLFISMASHELKTPLTSVNGYIQLLNTKLSGADTIESRWMTQLSNESLRLTNLVKELMEINRIKSGTLQYFYKECKLTEVIERALGNFKFSHPDRNVIFEDQLGQQDDLIIGDFDKLIQIIVNVLDNAAKFSSPETKIYLTLCHKGSYLSIEIKDSGVGITKKDLPKLFHGFYKGGTYNKEGMGLGLFLVKEIVNRHHGTIKIISKEGKGTVVKIKLPALKYDRTRA